MKPTHVKMSVEIKPTQFGDSIDVNVCFRTSFGATTTYSRNFSSWDSEQNMKVESPDEIEETIRAYIAETRNLYINQGLKKHYESPVGQFLFENRHKKIQEDFHENLPEVENV